MFDLEQLQKNFAKDLSNMPALIARGVHAQLYGSFSERHPNLGKMRRCPFCRQRRYQNAPERCCNAAYAKTQRAWSPELGFHQVECAERVSAESMFPKKLIRRVMHKRHGQNKMFRVRQLLARLRESDEFVALAVKKMNDKQPHLKLTIPKDEHLPSFAEQYYAFLEE